jgi:hypothetical protein
MDSEIYTYFSDDHQRLEYLLDHAFGRANQINEIAYGEFRSGLLKHIALEEKILLPAIQKANVDRPHPSAAQLRLEHGAFAALLVPAPSAIIKKVFSAIIPSHNKLEESADGIYAICDRLPLDQIHDIMQKIKEYPSVPVMPYSHKPDILESTRRAIRRAGYDFDKIGI